MSMRPPLSEIQFIAVRSRGPGGQNVNKVASAAVLYWDYLASDFFTPDEKIRLTRKLKNMINAEGLVHLRSDEFRDLGQNKSRSYEKLLRAVNAALYVQKKRIKTKPSRNQKEKRLQGKGRRSQIKANRRRVDHSD